MALRCPDPYPTPDPGPKMRLEAITAGLYGVVIVLLGWGMSHYPTVAMQLLPLDAEHTVLFGHLSSVFGGLGMAWGAFVLALVRLSRREVRP
jgi:hypothetical protein